MLARVKTVALMLAAVTAFGVISSKQCRAANVLNGQNTDYVHLVLDNAPNHTVSVEIFNAMVRFYVDGSNVPMTSYYNNTFSSLHIVVTGGANGNSIVFNDHSTAYLDPVDVQLEFIGGAGTDSVEHGINYWTQAPIASYVTNFPCALYGFGGSDYLDGGNGDDLIVGHDGYGNLSGGGGDDSIFGGNGMDSIHGDDGDDFIDGGSGWNFLYGDDGNDTLNGGNSWDTIEGGAGDDTIKGKAGNDTLSGGDDNDLILGGPGNDNIYGDDGDDVIKGESGLDEIFGGEGDDVMDGAGSQNMFWGFGLWYPTHHDSSNDIIEGGPGADWFKNYMHIKPAGNLAVIADEDTRVDFNPGEGDIATQAIWQMTQLKIVYLSF